MQFFPYHFPFLGNGMVIALNAVFHVLISHGIGIGAFAMLIFGEFRFGTLKPNSIPYEGWTRFNKEYLRYSVMVITILGSITGAGIWFTIMSLTPPGVSSMLRIFFWAWYFEYFVFLGEIVVLLIIYFKWDSFITSQRHLLARFGTAYVLLSFFSAVSIAAVLGFMLTPGAWIQTRGFWQGVLNPSFLPQLVTRLAFSVILGSLCSLAGVVFFGHESFKREGIRFFSWFLLISLLVFLGGLSVYYYVIPLAFSSHIRFSVLTSNFSRYPGIWNGLNLLFFALLFLCAFSSRRGSISWTKVFLIPAIVSICVLVAEFERIREFIRGPYLMPGHMYANGIILEEGDLLKTKGILASNPWFKAVYPPGRQSQGAFLFGVSCTVCHTYFGANDIPDALALRSRDGIFVLLKHLHEIAPFMPPFEGNENERGLLADYLYDLMQGKIRFQRSSRSFVEEGHE